MFVVYWGGWLAIGGSAVAVTGGGGGTGGSLNGHGLGTGGARAGPGGALEGRGCDKCAARPQEACLTAGPLLDWPSPNGSPGLRHPQFRTVAGTHPPAHGFGP